MMVMGRTMVHKVTVIVAALAFSACGAGATAGAASTSPSTRPPDHMTKLARGETRGIASQLTRVRGYRYVDPPASEVRQAATALKRAAKDAGVPDLYSAFALHSVVARRASQNTAHTASGGRETGLLQLYEFSTAPPGDLDQEQLARLGMGKARPASSFRVNGVDVLVWKRPKLPDSRWLYTWYRHGVQGGFDGATRAATERWVRAYLSRPEREPYENDALAAQLVPVSGFAYTNWWVPFVDKALKAIRPLPASVHAVANADGRVGTIILVDAPVPPAELAGDLAPALGGSGTSQATTISGVPVVTVSVPQGTIYAWSHNGITGVFTGQDPAQSLAFLTPYLANVTSPSAPTASSNARQGGHVAAPDAVAGSMANPSQ